jgi:hypothetical protein
MKLNNRGSIAGMLVAGISVIALAATVIGITQNNLGTSSQAALNSTGVMLQENTLDVRRIDDTHVEISGQICYSRHLQSGGKEEWTLWATDNRGKALDGENDGSYIDGGRLYVAGNGSFPASCEYVDRAAGIGKMLDKNQKQPHRFSVIATTPRRLSASYCPEVYLHYRGTWFSGTPFAKIALDQIKDVCGPTESPTPTLEPGTGPTTDPTEPSETPGPSETPAPSDAPVTPTLTPTPTPDGTISGRVSVFACKKPSRVAVDFCTGETCDELNGGKVVALPFTPGPSDHGIWLDDTNDDGTWMYKYRISTDENNKLLDPSKTYFLSRAAGFFDNDATYFDSEREQGEKLRVKPGDKRDFEVYANRTCGCAFDAVSYVKDTSGNILTALDNKPGIYGTVNNKQLFDRGDKPIETLTFNNLGSNPGRVDFHLTDLGDFRETKTWGRDALAAVKLYADDYRVVKQECTSKNSSVPACPGYTDTWSETDMSKLRNPKIFENLRIACNANLEYGWVLEKIPPTPTPQPPAAEPPVGGAPIGSVSCALRDDNNVSATQNEGCKPRNFRIKEIKERTANLEWDVAGNCPAFKRGSDRYWIIVKDKETGEIVASRRGMKDEDTGVKTNDRNPGEAPHQVNVVRRDYYDEGHEYTAYLYSFLDKDGACMSNPVSLDFTGVARDDSDDPEEPKEPGDPGSGGGVCPQWCTNDEFCRSRGYVPKDPPAGEHCSVAGDRWCCPPGTEPPGGEGPGGGGNPGNPGNPGGGNPGGGGQGVCPANSYGQEGRVGESFIKVSSESDRGVCQSVWPGSNGPVNASDGGYCCSFGTSGGPGGGTGGGGNGQTDPYECTVGTYGPFPASANKCVRANGFMSYNHPLDKNTGKRDGSRHCCGVHTADIGSCSAQDGLRGVGINRDQAVPGNKDEATARCTGTYGSNLVEVVKSPNSKIGTSGFCCKIKGNIGTCDNEKKEYGINGRSPAFPSKGEAEKQCREMGIDNCSAQKSRTGTGYCSKIQQPEPTKVVQPKYRVTIKYKIEAFRLTAFTLKPVLSGPVPFLFTGSEFTLGSLHGTNTYEHNVLYNDVPKGKHSVQCSVVFDGSNTKLCTPAEINVTGDTCYIYNISVRSGVIDKSSLGSLCPSNGARPIQPVSIDLDINQDGVINTIDLQYLYDEYGAEGASTTDVNQDGAVNALDLSIFMNSFGTEL